MIPSSSALVSLKPARQAALQAIMTVEEARQRGATSAIDATRPDIPAPADRL
ncbi:plasmid SOS inhibition protein A [Klebsiella pneumoniae]|nr:plasmid SOS inhibition protein A [Klebsiella pneumoniae]